MGRILGLVSAIPFAALAVVVASVSAGSLGERVFLAAAPGLVALRLAVGKGRAPGLLLLSLFGAFGTALALLITAHPIGDQAYPFVERVRYALLLSGVATLPLAILLPFRKRVSRALVLVVACLAYAPVAFGALQVHRPHVRAVWSMDEPAPRSVEVEAPDGAVLRGWTWAGRTDRSPLVLLLHGIGASRGDVVHLGRIYRQRGWAVGMFDSRGHGESDSMTVTFGVKERSDVRAIVEQLTRHDPAIPVALHGCSLGASIALQAAAELPQVRAVVAEAPFLDLASMASARVSWLPGPLATVGLLTFRAAAPIEIGATLDEVSPARAIARRQELRTLLIVGGRDHVIPPTHGRRLNALAAGPSELWELPNAEHCGAWAAAPEEFPQRVSDVLRAAFRVAEPHDDSGRPSGPDDPAAAAAPRP